MNSVVFLLFGAYILGLIYFFTRAMNWGKMGANPGRNKMALNTILFSQLGWVLFFFVVLPTTNFGGLGVVSALLLLTPCIGIIGLRAYMRGVFDPTPQGSRGGGLNGGVVFLVIIVFALALGFILPHFFLQ